MASSSRVDLPDEEHASAMPSSSSSVTAVAAAAGPATSDPSAPSTPSSHGHIPTTRLKRLASKPLKPLKLAASAIHSVSYSRSSTPTPQASFDDEEPARPSGSTLLGVPDAKPPGPRPGKHRSISSQHITDPVLLAQATRGPRKPLEGEDPAAWLRVRVNSAEGLVVKDRNGSSDPFVSILLAPSTRYTTPVVKRSLNPIFPAAQSTFDFPIYLSLAGVIGGRGLEGVVWDKDLMRKEYMGELFVGVDQWFSSGTPRLWGEDLPLQTYELISTRRKQKVSGTVSLQIGFVEPPSTDPAEALTKVTKVYNRILENGRGQFGVLGVPAHEGIGTVMIKRGDSQGDELPRLSSGRVGLTSSALAAPSMERTHSQQPGVGFHDFTDDGLTSSEDEMDAADADDEGYLRDTPLSYDDLSGLDVAGAELLPPRSSSLGVKAHDQEPLSPQPTYEPLSPMPDASRRSSAPGSTPPTPGVPSTPGTQATKKKRRIFGRGKSRKEFNFTQDSGRGVLGIVVMEIHSANDLPKLKNTLRTGWDMDPFVVISFGKKVFRTRVIRHSLNPTWDEKLLFHVHDHEQTFTVQMAVLDWDKISGNDFVGTSTLPLSDLAADAPKPDPVTGLYPENVDGKHDFKHFTLPILTSKSMSWEARHSPTLTVRAKFEPYDALRQRFWRQYIKQYDTDSTGAISHFELSAMLDSLGSTLTHQTIESFFTRFGKTPDKDELTFDEVIQCMEREIHKTSDQKREASKDDSNAVDPDELNEQLLRSWPRGGEDSTLVGSTPSTLSDNQDSYVPSVKVDNSGTSSQDQSLRPSHTASPPALSDTEDGGDGSGAELERVINIKACPLCHRSRLGKRSERDIITHLAICASSDWGRVDRIMTGNYVTSSQAQRKLVTKLINKVAIGTYSLGANSANILVQDRLTGQFQEEKMAVYVRLGIRVLYKGARGKMAGARAKRLLKSMSIKQGIKYDSPSSVADIKPFIAFHRLNVEEILDPLDSFKTFNEFFYRRLKPGARPVEDPGNERRLVSAADCRLMVFDTVSDAKQIWIKGRDFTVSRLIGPTYQPIVSNYNGGALAIFRLAPQDYHRFHSPVRGRIGKMTDIDGEYYTVNPQAIRTALDVYGENVRKVVPIISEEFGTVMTIWVGAMMVGSIGTSVEEGQMVERGDELGWFAFGGSTLVVVFERGRVIWDEDLQANGKAAIETLVRVGMGLGRTAPSPVPSRENSTATL
ncbi:phosphatidylserine decarboxylase [Vanrija albida]|uniref:Phosphatidylserine decarboxylase proenzyme 2 n=1 Tax=Vanrija albida TaxID=181172 RepID=A0ABR3PS43_9TREE